MALIQCPECGHDVSDKALACPSCGLPLYYSNDEIVALPVRILGKVVELRAKF